MYEGISLMMEALREGAKTWVAKVLLGLVMVVFAILGVSSMDISATINGLFKKDLATVGGQVIGSELFQRDLNNSIQQFKNQTGTNITLEDARRLGLDKQVLDRLIAQTAIDAQTERLGLSIAEQAVVSEVQSQPVFGGAGAFDVNRFRAVLQQNGLTEQGFMAMTKTEMQRKAATSLAGENLTLPRTLLDALTRYREESRDGRYLTFSVTASDIPRATDADLKKQYETTPAAYTAPEYRSIVLMKVDPADMAPKIQISETEITEAYDRFKDEYFEPEKRDLLQVSFPDIAAATKAKARIDAGEDIVKIADEAGQKPADITFNGKLKGDFLDDKINEAAFSLAQGSVSAPIAGSLNTVLLKAVKVVPAHQPTLAELKSQLQQRLQLQKAQDEIQSVYDAVEDARAQQTKFEDIAAKAGLPINIVPAVSASGVDKTGNPVALPAAGELLKAVFASDVGLDTDALQANEGYIWYDVREVIPSAVKPMDQVKEQVKADYAATKLRAYAAEKAKAILAKAGTTTKLETLATELGGTIKAVTGIKRNAVSEEFDGAAALALFSVPEKTLTWSLLGDGTSAQIIEVSKVTLPAAGLNASTQQIVDVAKQGLSGDLADAYLKSARASTKVTINEELWRQISDSTTTTP
jgi:peptidyl-prolyl cis-trans isomerase D